MRNLLSGSVAAFLILTSITTASAQGIAVTGVGPVNRSMGGAGTAAPLDAIGALHWNPASISYLEHDEVSFGMEGLLADIELSSTVGGSTHTTNGEAGVAVIPSVGWVDHLEGTPITIGMGVYGIGGFRNNMPMDASNPLLASGPVFADAEIMQIAPTISMQLGERWSVGIAPTITAARMMFDPLGPSAITPTATAGSGNRVHWGGGIQGGVYYASPNCWRAGFTVKSPQWFEEFRFFTSSGVVGFDLDYPLILSGGLAYYGWERWVFAADVRYFDYANTAGFKDLGWQSVFAGAIGAQYQLTDLWKLRAGYNFNQNPIGSEDVFTNIASPLIQTHNIALGAGCLLTDNVELNLAYVYLVNSEVSGPLPSPPFGANDTMSHRINAHSLLLGVQIRY
ncbi:OmpP1/FadL family transporter [Bremerella cremea]|uniref:OmpP1/FadL family transporter n=1 Tax=Bremerella cremea TaxID=1031537 RepID=UPI0031F009B9